MSHRSSEVPVGQECTFSIPTYFFGAEYRSKERHSSGRYFVKRYRAVIAVLVKRDDKVTR